MSVENELTYKAKMSKSVRCDKNRRKTESVDNKVLKSIIKIYLRPVKKNQLFKEIYCDLSTKMI